MSVWSDEVLTYTKREWTAGKAASILEVALWQEFRVKVTRSAIIAKMNRDGHISPKSYKAGADRVPQKRNYRRVPWAPPKPQKAAQRLPKAEQATFREAPIPEPVFLRKTLLQLGNHDCRFVLGETAYPAIYCGAECDPDSSLCAYHHRLCWHRPTNTPSQGAKRSGLSLRR